MFLKHLRNPKNERGNALIGVTVTMMVLAVVTVGVASSTNTALQVTGGTRDSVQARAAAEAGIAAAVASLQSTNGCATNGLNYTSASNPNYVAVVESYSSSIGGWIASCPQHATPEIRITSVGTSPNGDDTATLEAVYEWEPIVVQIPVVGSAVYADRIIGNLKKFELESASNTIATSVTIRSGDVVCTNGASIGGDLILGAGNATLDMCDIAGSVHVAGDVSINKSDIGGDVRASATGIAVGNASVTNSTVGGRAYASGTVTHSNTTFGDGSPMSGQAVPNPPIPTWKDIPSTTSFWTSRGYTVVQWSGACAISKSSPTWDGLDNFTSKTVIDFRTKCPTGISTSSNMNNVEIQTDLVLLSNGFDFTKIYFTSKNNVARTLTFVVPDDTADSLPTCAAPNPSDPMSGGIYFSSESDFSTNIAAMVYTPCKILSDRNGFRGQMYGGEVEFRQQASLTFVPVGVEGIDFTEGATTPLISGSRLSDLIYLRDLQP